MCESVMPVKRTKVDKLIEAIDRLTAVVERQRVQRGDVYPQGPSVRGGNHILQSPYPGPWDVPR